MVNRLRRRLCRALVAAVVATLSAVAVLGAALADDLPALTARAQQVADRVTAIEHQLHDLRARRGSLRARISSLAEDIGSLQARIHDYDAAVEAARRRYVDRAVEAYKGGLVDEQLDLLLSTRDLDDLQSVAQAQSVAAALDSRRLDELVAARAEAAGAQQDLDHHMQRLQAAQTTLDSVSAEVGAALDGRRAELYDLRREITALQRAAARDAAAAKRTERRAGPGAPTSPPAGDHPAVTATADLPAGYSSTGVTFGGEASWYGPGFAGHTTANGEIFDPQAMTVASKELSFNTLLFVSYQGKGVVVRVNDRGPYAGNRILDLSQGAAETIGMSGVGWVHVTVVLKA